MRFSSTEVRHNSPHKHESWIIGVSDDLGIYKSLLTAYIDSGGEFGWEIDDEGTSVRDKAEAILRIIHGLASTACNYGFFLQR